MRELQRFFPEPLPPAEEVARALSLHSFEVEAVEGEGEWATIDIDVLPNRGADALSHRGIAREVAALFDLPFINDPLAREEPTWSEGSGVALRMAAEAPVDRYLAALVCDVSVAPSPEWMQKTLLALGLRPINNVVDATNLVMLRIGQPLHAFDAARIASGSDGAKVLSVRPSKAQERIVLLGGEEVSLPEGIPIVADAVAGTSLAIGGIKGGAAAEVTEQTRHIILEAAHFPPLLVRKAVRSLGVTTDAAQRFQHNPSARLAAYGLAEVLALIQEVAGGTLQGVAQWYPQPEEEPSRIVVPLAAWPALSGAAVSPREATRTLEKIGCRYEVKGEKLEVLPPWERRDLHIPEDVVEEVIRLRGYDTLAAQPMPAAPPPPADPLQVAADRIRLALAGLGWSEIMTYMLRERGEVCLANALAADKACLRVSLAEGLWEALERNEPFAPLAGDGALMVFEIGEVIRKAEGATPPWCEALHLALGVLQRGKKARKKREQILAQAKEAVEALVGPLHWVASHERAVLEARIDEVVEREAGGVNPYTLKLWNDAASYTPPSPFPVVVRDVAVWVPEGLDEATLLAVVRAHAGVWARRVSCIDRYERDGRTSLTFRIVLQASDHTLSDEEANAVQQQVAQALSAKGCEVR